MIEIGRVIIIVPPESSNSQYSIVADFDDNNNTKEFLQAAYKHFRNDDNIDYDPSHTITINYYGNNQYSICSCKKSHRQTLKILRKVVQTFSIQ